MQKELGSILKQFKQVFVVELNTGQLCHLIRSRYLVDAKSIQKIAGKPFTVSELKEQILALMEAK
jgi:2-oxoglutarate ferredoxin oxidoreductase subunit alpha